MLRKHEFDPSAAASAPEGTVLEAEALLPGKPSVLEENRSHLRWSYLSTASTAAMQLIAAATITRFLQPSDYGLAALAVMCYTMTGYFTQLGVGRAIIQKPALTQGNVRAGFWLAVLTGVAGFAVLLLLSPVLTSYFREPRLQAVIVVFGLNLIFQALGMTAAGLLRRELRIRDLAICDFLGYLLSTFGVGLPMAMHGFGVWALVGSNVSQPLIVAIAYFLARPHSIRPTWQRGDYAQLTQFSAKASLTTTIEALGGSLDLIVMGRVLAPLAVGLYNRGLTLSTQPSFNLSMGLTRVFHPTIARAAERSLQECFDLLENGQRQLMSVILPFGAGAAIAAPVIIPAVFGPQWNSCIPAYRVLCLVAVLDASFHLPAIQLEILSLFRNKFILQVGFGIGLGLGTLFFAPRGGITAVAITYAVLQGVRTIIFHELSARSLGVTSLALFKSWIPGLLCSSLLAAVLAIAELVLSRSAISSSALQLVILLLLSTITVAAVYRRFYRDSVYRQWMALLRR